VLQSVNTLQQASTLTSLEAEAERGRIAARKAAVKEGKAGGRWVQLECAGAGCRHRFKISQLQALVAQGLMH
jgi:hypothetical protein